ncbi:hypothetical protein CORC01_09741 [Colletotrichum orchidophilum]|uniref:Uncharacterized protein n=1 Tax=Colletotrichum orchidophilum TaxID=1209926 RepID=A0A1G4B0N7_9PEZI|nr:uncharacterized protein CORC01_09741 [Colletotrichum orchidophilum]OHE94947.1 hypothetical protein CORC01_09741 [Colletotrichum orchidophilum]
MEPSKAFATNIPVSERRDIQRQTICTQGHDDEEQQQQQQLDSPPPYEPSSTGSTSAPAKPGTTATDLTPPSPSRLPVLADQFDEVDEARSTRSSFEGDDAARLLAGRKSACGEYTEGYKLTPQLGVQGSDGGGYAKTQPMSVGGGDDEDKWEALRDTPGCCFSLEFKYPLGSNGSQIGCVA